MVLVLAFSAQAGLIEQYDYTINNSLIDSVECQKTASDTINVQINTIEQLDATVTLFSINSILEQTVSLQAGENNVLFDVGFCSSEQDFAVQVSSNDVILFEKLDVCTVSLEQKVFVDKIVLSNVDGLVANTTITLLVNSPKKQTINSILYVGTVPVRQTLDLEQGTNNILFNIDAATLARAQELIITGIELDNTYVELNKKLGFNHEDLSYYQLKNYQSSILNNQLQISVDTVVLEPATYTVELFLYDIFDQFIASKIITTNIETDKQLNFQFENTAFEDELITGPYTVKLARLTKNDIILLDQTNIFTTALFKPILTAQQNASIGSSSTTSFSSPTITLQQPIEAVEQAPNKTINRKYVSFEQTQKTQYNITTKTVKTDYDITSITLGIMLLIGVLVAGILLYSFLLE